MMLTVEEYMALRRLIDSERESESSTLAAREETPAKKKPRKKNTKYAKAFRKVQGKYKLKSGKWKKGGFKAAVKAAHKEAKK